MPTKPKNNKSYIELSDELSEIMTWFDSPDIDVDQALEKYEQAMKLIAKLEAYLKTAEVKVRKISASFEQ